MATFLVYITEWALTLTLLYSLYGLLLRRETFHDINRGILLLILCLSAILPLCPVETEHAWFFHFDSGKCIIDRETGDRYMLREMEFYPTDTCFWIKGAAGKYVRFVQKFPPLPLSVKEIEFFSPSAPSRYNFDGSAWKASARVEDLRPKTRTGKIIY